MSERPGGGLTPGDPLGGSSPERPSDGLWAGTPGYTTPAPPGAGGPQPSVPMGVGDRPVLSGWWRRVGAQLIDGAIIFVGALIILGILGDQSFVRERARVGEGSVVGRGSAVDNDVLIGARVRIQTDVYLTAYSVVEDDVFVGPGAMTTNDSTMARHGDDYPIEGALLRRACRVGGAAVLTPGTEIGEEAFVAAGAVVVRDVPARAVVMGVPARVVREVGDEDLLERWR